MVEAEERKLKEREEAFHEHEQQHHKSEKKKHKKPHKGGDRAKDDHKSAERQSGGEPRPSNLP